METLWASSGEPHLLPWNASAGREPMVPGGNVLI